MREKKAYLIAGTKSWNRTVYEEIISAYPGNWYFVDKKEELTLVFLQAIRPRFIFFLHWSWKVPPDIFQSFECVCFHMSDVPHGRGGSPLQNLILRGQRQTKLTALQMVEAFDAGPVYLKRALSLEGSAEEIYIRATYLSAEMIRHLVENEPTPAPQQGEVTLFDRRKPEESRIPQRACLKDLHDFIRMLDAQGFPNAFLDYKGFRYAFTRAALYDGCIRADVKITAKKGGADEGIGHCGTPG